MSATAELADRPLPDVSLVVPCYNEESCLASTVPPLIAAFRQAGIELELVLVDNGSRDRTAQVIDRLIAEGLPILKGAVPVNQGQGLGIRTGLALCRGRFVGYVCADGQVAPEDVVRVYRAASAAAEPALAKARRLERGDSPARRLISHIYNGLVCVLFPGIASRDVNGNPKIWPRELLSRFELAANDWFLEAEIMLKARHLRLRVIEIDVSGRAREGGRSHVRLATILEFARNLLAYRCGGPWRDWRRQVRGKQPLEIPLPPRERVG